MTETLEELQLPREAVESESRGAIYSVPIVEDGGGARSPPEDPAEAPRTLLGNWSPLVREAGVKLPVLGLRPSDGPDPSQHLGDAGHLSSTLPPLAFPAHSTPNSLGLGSRVLPPLFPPPPCLPKID